MRDDDIQKRKLEALGRFAGGIAHDFNNILSIIEGYTQVALTKAAAGTVTAADLEKILNLTQRGAGLTRQLLAFSRQKVDPAGKINLAAALRDQRVLLTPLLGSTIRLHLNLPPRGVWVMASADFVTQIILNLALNARDAMPRGGSLSITLETTGQEARLIVADSGDGIAPAHLPRIFEPFFTTKEQGKGTGLGLSVVYGIVEQLGGSIHAQSTPGQGTRFDITLPLVQAPAAIAPPDKHEFKDRTILIAEDEPELRDVLAVIFTGMEMKVLTAGNGNEAMDVQHRFKGRIDFLLTDVVMPGMDGVTLGEMFAKDRPDSNVIYMSGYPFMDSRVARPLPADADFLPKPLRDSKIREILHRALERRDARLRGEVPPDPPEDDQPPEL